MDLGNFIFNFLARNLQKVIFRQIKPSWVDIYPAGVVNLLLSYTEKLIDIYDELINQKIGP